MKSETLHVWNFLDRNRAAIAQLNDNIFYFGELGMQEFETAGLMTHLLEQAGFDVIRGISGFATGFCATYGTGYPTVAIHTEYDAVPDNSQESGVTSPKPIVEGAPGHCEGHNVNAAVLIGAALAAKSAMHRFGLKGTLKVFGGAAEEQLISRPYYVRDGWFDDVDVAFHDHIAGYFATAHGVTQQALISSTFTFHGETAHAGVAPWKGRDALDAVVLMDMGLAQYREHMIPTMRAQRVITHGGDQPNVVPRKASVWWFFRAPTAGEADSLFDQAKRIAEGAALMTKTSVEINILSAVWPSRGNRVLAELVQRQIESVGMPQWSEEEQAFACELQTNANVKSDGLTHHVQPLREATQRPSANDAGDVSWKVPMVKFYFPANVPNLSAHHWAAGAALATSIAHKGAVAGAKVMAGAAIECFLNPAVVEEAKRTFRDELGSVEYRSLLPAEQEPPINLNRDIMEKFRPLMARRYLKNIPRFLEQ
jgi:aminobenzoyl-glutamate utilization protein B